MRTLLVMALLGAGALTAPSPAQDVEWMTDLVAAKAAATDGKLVLASFTSADNSATTLKLKSEVFEKPEFAKWAAEKAVLLSVDLAHENAEQKAANAKLAKDLGVRNFPLVLFLDAEGKKVAQVAYKPGGVNAWLGHADKALAAAQKDAAKPATFEWLTSYEDALARAKAEKKLILADFTGSDWCGWCIKLKSEVFDTPEFKDWATKNVVLLELDFPKQKQLPKELADQNAKLRDKNGVSGYPTILFFDFKGEKVGQTGYVEGGPSKWIPAAEQQMGGKRRR